LISPRIDWNCVRKRAIGGLQKTNAVCCVLGGLVECGNVGAQTVCNRQTGWIFCSGVDAETGGKLLECGLQGRLRVGNCILRHQGRNVVQYTNAHGKAPRIDFRLHRTRSVYITVQNRYLEQVVVATRNLSAGLFLFSSRSEKNFAISHIRPYSCAP